MSAEKMSDGAGRIVFDIPLTRQYISKSEKNPTRRIADDAYFRSVFIRCGRGVCGDSLRVRAPQASSKGCLCLSFARAFGATTAFQAALSHRAPRRVRRGARVDAPAMRCAKERFFGASRRKVYSDMRVRIVPNRILPADRAYVLGQNRESRR